MQQLPTDPSLVRSFKGHKDHILSCCFSPNLKHVVSGSKDSTVMVWHYKVGQRPFRFVGHKGPVHSVAICQNGNTIVSGSADCTIRLWKNTVEGSS
jgi:centriolar protein POC1